MSIANNNIVARVAAVVAGLGLVASSFVAFAPAAQAQSTTDLQAQIAALMAQIAALQAQAGGSASAGTTFTRDLTLGSSGADVTALQNWLIKMGASIPAGATGYFGAQTQAALAKWQASAGITPAAGYFGPITRAKVNASAGGSTGGTDDDDDDTDDDTDTDLQGGAGSVDTYTLMSSINSEEVGEDEEDVEVAGLEIEADDGSDLDFTAVRLVFDEGTADQDFEDYATEVSVWFDGEEVGRVDADAFNDDNNWTTTVSLDGAVLEAGETGELTVAVSGIANLDTGDATETWTVDFRQVRFIDAEGSTISEDPATAARTFSFQTFATAADVELKIKEDDVDINDARTIEVDATSDTDSVDALSFTLEAEGDSDVEIKTYGVSVTVTGVSDTEDIVKNLTLWIDGEEVASANTVSSGGLTENYIFDDVDYVIEAGDTVEVLVKADINDTNDDFGDGDTIAFAINEDIDHITTVIKAEDESGENLADADLTGSVTSGAFELRTTGVMVTLVSVNQSVSAIDSADNDTGTFTIKVNVEAFGGTVYVASSSQATTANTIAGASLLEHLYRVDQGSTATTADLSDAVSYTTTGGAALSSTVGNIVLTEGEDTDLTFTVTRTNNSDSSDSGLFRVLLKAVAWDTADEYGSYNIYNFNLEDFKTDYISLD